MEQLAGANERTHSVTQLVTSRAVPAESHAAPELALNYCPGCSVRLAPRSCKLICPSCGYYMSCSDFY
jgi:hypothetical protein